MRKSKLEIECLFELDKDTPEDDIVDNAVKNQKRLWRENKVRHKRIEKINKRKVKRNFIMAFLLLVAGGMLCFISKMKQGSLLAAVGMLLACVGLVWSIRLFEDHHLSKWIDKWLDKWFKHDKSNT